MGNRDQPHRKRYISYIPMLYNHLKIISQVKLIFKWIFKFFSFIFIKSSLLWAFFSFALKSPLTQTNGIRTIVYSSTYGMFYMFQMFQIKKFGASWNWSWPISTWFYAQNKTGQWCVKGNKIRIVIHTTPIAICYCTVCFRVSYKHI